MASSPLLPPESGRLWPARILRPPVHCPVCGLPVQGFNLSNSTDGGYDAYPCYCPVLPSWASALMAEMERRQAGKAPRDVDHQAKAIRKQQIESLQAEICIWTRCRDAAALADLKGKVVSANAHINQKLIEWRNLCPGDDPPASSMEIQPITLEALRDALKEDGGYAGRSPGEIFSAARLMLLELKNFVEKDEAVHSDTLRVVCVCCPAAAHFLVLRNDQTSLNPENDPDAAARFSANLARRRQRRIQVRDDGKPPPPA